MKSNAWLVVALVVAGCSSGEAPPPAPVVVVGPAAGSAVPATAAGESPVTPGYAKDIEKLCDAVRLSGADQVPYGERALPIANWLAANLTTPESRKFLVRIQPLVGDDKANVLDAEARRVGHAGCALAAEWRR